MNDTLDTATQSFRLLAQSASTAAVRTDRLFVAMLLVCGGMAVLLAVLVIGLSLRYREGNPVDRSDPPSHAGGLEAAWTIAPLLIFLGIFAWAAHDGIQVHRVGADALPIHVVAKQWMWRVQHRNGRQEINEMHVPMGQPVVLVLASQDVIHSFFVPAFRLKQDVVPGRYTELAFTATELGSFPVYCSEYCGSQHSAMLARVVVMPPEDYARWLDARAPSGTPTGAGADADDPVAVGRALYERLACASCHATGSSVHAPPLEGLYGSRVRLASGETVTADDQYLRDAITQPHSQVVAGHADLMPSYQGQVDEPGLQALVAYLRSLAPPAAVPAATAPTPASNTTAARTSP